MILGLAVAALLSQDAIEAEAKFRAALGRAEKAGLTVPDLPDGVRELETLLFPALPKDLRHRFDTVRAQSTVLSAVHAQLVKNKGGLFELPLPTGKPVSVRIVDVFRRTVKISKSEVGQEYSFSDLDSEWMVAAAKPDLAQRSDAALLGGLWLAKATKWDAAMVYFGDVETDHPLVVEARKRGVEAAIPALDALIKGKRWTESLAKLEALDRLAPTDARLAVARAKLLDAIVETGKELCRKKSKGPMQEVIDLITKHFPDGASRIDDIREAGRWVRITEPKRFQIEGTKGPPWLLEPRGDKEVHMAWLDRSSEAYEGVAAVVRFPKGVKTRGGLAWEDGIKIVSINAEDASVNVYSGNKGERLPNVFHKKINLEARHQLSVRLRNGFFVVQYNGEEIYRTEGRLSGFENIALSAREGKVWFDEVQLLKKE